MTRKQDYISRAAAARRLGVSVQRIEQLSQSRRLGRQIAGHWIYTTAELDAYRQERDAHPKGGRPRLVRHVNNHHAEGQEVLDITAQEIHNVG